MPTRKQRRRREKDFRHDVRVYEVDEEGNEVPIADLRSREEKQEKPAKAKAKSSQQAKGRPARGIRDVQPPSWERALKRGGMMGGLMLVVFVFLLNNGPLAQRIGIGAFYAVAFVPLTYWVDRTAYRSYQKRLARSAGAGKKKR
jgi:hypothetical protein